jgi:hypothetical protein
MECTINLFKKVAKTLEKQAYFHQKEDYQQG